MAISENGISIEYEYWGFQCIDESNVKIIMWRRKNYYAIHIGVTKWKPKEQSNSLFELLVQTTIIDRPNVAGALLKKGS